jgi:hypothetical protein
MSNDFKTTNVTRYESNNKFPVSATIPEVEAILNRSIENSSYSYEQ